MNNRLLIIIITSVLISIEGTAQDRISADRPGAGYSASTVPAKMFYVEAGASINEGQSDIGQFFLRTGLSKDFEFQLNTGSLLFVDALDKPRVSAQSLAFKYSIGAFQDNKLQLSFFSRTNLPVFNDDFEYYLTRFMVLGDYSVNDIWSINSNFGYGDFVNGLKNGSFNFNITPGFSINEHTGGYFGYAVIFDENFSNDLVEGGIVYFLDNSFQVDGGFIYTPNDLFVSFGVAKSF